LLANYLDQRITITGMFDKYTFNYTGIRQWRVALLQDVYAEVEGKQIDLGHIWVQHAESLKGHDLGYGDRIKCNCRVSDYKKRLRTPNEVGLMVVTKYNLSWPTEIEVISRATRPEAVAGPSPVQPLNSPGPGCDPQRSTTDPVSLVLEVKRLAEKACGWESLHQLVEALRG
jgi:hypothetical protein